MGDDHRPASWRERCPCGRQAVVVFLRHPNGPVGWCGQTGRRRPGPCPICGREHYDTVLCPDYTLMTRER